MSADSKSETLGPVSASAATTNGKTEENSQTTGSPPFATKAPAAPSESSATIATKTQQREEAPAKSKPNGPAKPNQAPNTPANSDKSSTHTARAPHVAVPGFNFSPHHVDPEADTPFTFQRYKVLAAFGAADADVEAEVQALDLWVFRFKAHHLSVVDAQHPDSWTPFTGRSASVASPLPAWLQQQKIMMPAFFQAIDPENLPLLMVGGVYFQKKNNGFQSQGWVRGPVPGQSEGNVLKTYSPYESTWTSGGLLWITDDGSVQAQLLRH